MAGSRSTPSDVNEEVKLSGHVMMVFTAIGKFITFMFRKTHFETVVAEIYGLGNFLRNCTIGKIGDTQFIPNTLLQHELKVVKQFPTKLKEPT